MAQGAGGGLFILGREYASFCSEMQGLPCGKWLRALQQARLGARETFSWL